MKLVCDAKELKERSEELDIPFADLLRGYVLEDMMLRVSTSSYKDSLWLETYPVLGEEIYRGRSERRIHFLYQESERVLPPEKLQPGQKLSAALAEQMIADIFAKENKQEVVWNGKVSEQAEHIILHLNAVYREMQVPLTLIVTCLRTEEQRPAVKEEGLVVIPGKQISYLVYAPENQLGRNIFSMIEKLELIGDMKCYYDTYQILTTQSFGGRYILDELTALTENTPKLKTEQRIELLAGYRGYAYMRKRWEKYLRNHKQPQVPWEEALDLILTFIRPLWHCLCCNEIFFDDWMPELGRFLG